MGNRITTGLMIGLAVGAVAGALISPRSGRSNRAVLQEKLGQINEKVRRNQKGSGAEVQGSLTSEDADRLP